MPKCRLKFALCAFIACIFSITDAPSAAANEKLVSLGTAGVTGVYYPAGGAICRLVNRNRKDHNIRCLVESTGGSISNLEALKSKELDLGIVQSDWLYHAYNGTEIFKEHGENKKLRVLLALHSEPFTIVVRAGSGIKNFTDLKGKRVNIGTPGSGIRATMEELMKLKGWTENTFKSTPDLKTQDQANALCTGKIDAVIFALGHPNAAVQQITSMCDTQLVGIEIPEVDELIKENPYYVKTTIPGGIYLRNNETVKTFGVRALLVSDEDLSEEIAYEFVRSVFDNIDNFKSLHPVFASLDPHRMVSDAQHIAPLHQGAERYFKEKGLIK